MKPTRSGALPPDLKSFTLTNRHENLKEALRTVLMLIFMATIFMLIMSAAVPPEPREYPPGWEEMRG
jgi:hypothetical protein